MAAVPEDASKAGQKCWSMWRILPVALIAAGFGLAFAFGFNSYLSFETLRQHRDAIVSWAEAHAVVAALAFVAIYALAVALSLPGGCWLTMAGGFLFGTLAGAAYSMVAAVLGAVAVFLAARTAFADLLRQRAGCAVRRMERGFRECALSYLLFLRLVPVFPFWLVNLVPALLGIPLRTFVIGTVLGIIPGTLIYASVGGGLGAVLSAGDEPDFGIIFRPEILGPMIGLAVLALVPVFYKKLRHRRADNR